MAKVYEIDGLIPVIDPTAYVHDDAVLIGDVIIGPDCYVGPAASLRGDFGRLTIEAGVNIQDTCVMHGETVIGENGHIGHGAVLHCCRIGSNALVGMNAVIMDDAVIGESAIVAALSFVRAGFHVPPGALAVGAPARIVRELRDAERAWKKEATAEYQRLTRRCLQSMRPAQPLERIEADRPRLPQTEVAPLHATRKGSPADPAE